MTKFMLATALVLGTLAIGCTPSPEKVCNHMLDLAKAETKGDKAMSDEEKKKGFDACVKGGNEMKEKDAEAWKCTAKCSMAAEDFKAARHCDDNCVSKKTGDGK